MILVSGATGFLGAHTVCFLLKNNKQVAALKRKSSSLLEFDLIFNHHFKSFSDNQLANIKNNLKWHDADVLDLPALEMAFQNIEEVYHCAGIVSFEKKDFAKIIKTNVEGTTNMVNLSIEFGVKKFLHISSTAAIGRTDSGNEIVENTRWESSDLNSNYAISKHKAEMEVWRAKEEGLNVCIVNPSIILGIGDYNKGSVNIFKMLKKKLPFYTLGVNGFVDVVDVSRASFELMENNIFGQRFILVSENTSYKNLFFLIADGFNSARPKIEIGKYLSEISWRGVAFLKLFGLAKINITKETSRTSQKKYFYSNSKIKTAIGFEFKPLNQTIKEVCDFILHQ